MLEQDVIVQSVEREEYEVEKITRKRKRGRGYQFYVKWVGWKKPTWEPAHKLKNCAALDAFEARHGGPYESATTYCVDVATSK